jgi:hypothetical protein
VLSKKKLSRWCKLLACFEGDSVGHVLVWLEGMLTRCSVQVVGTAGTSAISGTFVGVTMDRWTANHSSRGRPDRGPMMMLFAGVSRRSVLQVMLLKYLLQGSLLWHLARHASVVWRRPLGANKPLHEAT